MLRPSLILSFIGLTAALSSGCDRANDVVEAGDGTCSGIDGVGVQCITYDKDGNPEESGGTCAGA